MSWARSLAYNVGMIRSRGHRHHDGKRKGRARDQTNAPDKSKPRAVESTRAQKSGSQGSLPPSIGNYGRELRELLSGIGSPKPAAFKPDPFQLEALAALEFEDVLVTAPTGSGKTWIAREEIRGHVWEEAIILTPPRIRMLLLSATIGNAEEFAAWIQEVRGVRCGVVRRPGARPVPLRAAFLMPDKRLLPLLNETGKLNPEIARMVEPP